MEAVGTNAPFQSMLSKVSIEISPCQPGGLSDLNGRPQVHRNRRLRLREDPRCHCRRIGRGFRFPIQAHQLSPISSRRHQDAESPPLSSRNLVVDLICSLRTGGSTGGSWS